MAAPMELPDEVRRVLQLPLTLNRPRRPRRLRVDQDGPPPPDDDDDDDAEGAVQRRAYNNYAQYPRHSRSLAVWRLFHFVVLDHRVGWIESDQWIVGSNIGTRVGRGPNGSEDEDVANMPPHTREMIFEASGDGYRVVDVDIEDANGKVYPLRIVYNGRHNNREVYAAQCGFWGKAFERPGPDDDRDGVPGPHTPRVLAEIKVRDHATSFEVACDEVKEQFADHEALGPLMEKLDPVLCKGFPPGHFDCQFSFLLGIALASVAEGQYSLTPVHMVNGTNFQRRLVQSLACPPGLEKCPSIAERVICESSPMQDLIIGFSAERNISCLPPETPDTSLDWFVQSVFWLVIAIHIHSSVTETAMTEAERQASLQEIAGLLDRFRRHNGRTWREYDVLQFDDAAVDRNPTPRVRTKHISKKPSPQNGPSFWVHQASAIASATDEDHPRVDEAKVNDFIERVAKVVTLWDAMDTPCQEMMVARSRKELQKVGL